MSLSGGSGPFTSVSCGCWGGVLPSHVRYFLLVLEGGVLLLVADFPFFRDWSARACLSLDASCARRPAQAVHSSSRAELQRVQSWSNFLLQKGPDEPPVDALCVSLV